MVNAKDLFLIVPLSFILGCGTTTHTHRDLRASLPSSQEITQTQRDQGQIPAETLRDASARYEGSMDPGTEASSPGGAKIINLVLGPVNLENFETPPPPAVDAGQRIREVIAQKITAREGFSLLDAPKERFINDSPRPGLARRGIQFVIKGVASFNQGSGKTTVFLRLVNTRTGKVALVASGRNEKSDAAASQAAERLLQKMEGKK